MTDSERNTLGTLHLVPVSLGEAQWQRFMPADVQHQVAQLSHFVVENARAARAHLKQLDFPGTLRETDIKELPADASTEALDALLAPALGGEDIGLMSDAGCPAVADPGARLVARAHALGIRVAPMVGPSSILLGLMGSGLNGQSFAFHGYLPVAEAQRDEQLRTLELESRRLGRTQIFIETPYRNDRMLEALLRLCAPSTRLCIAADLTTPAETLITRSIAEWRRHPPAPIGKRPALFLLLGEH